MTVKKIVKLQAKKPRTYAQKVAGKEANILSAAKQAFAENGYNGLRMSDVARRASVAEGTVYSYFASKDDLIRALIGAFWTQLTCDARDAIEGPTDSFSKLRALARFHINSLIARYDYAELTITLGRQTGSAISFTNEVRAFVRIFDEIFRSGQDRGEIAASAEIWIARDLFYGSLEYSARTLILRGGDMSTDAVVKNLMACMRAAYALESPSSRGSLQGERGLIRRQEMLTDKLEVICEKLASVQG